MRGAVSGARAWTEAEKSIVRARYVKDGAERLARELGRTVGAVRHVAERSGVLRARRWTVADDEQLALLWGEVSLRTIARRMNRTELTTYWRAQKLGLSLGVPQGYEYLTHAAQRTGYPIATLRRVLGFSSVSIHRTMSRPRKGSKTGRTFHYVDVYEVDRAVAKWCATEPIEVSARRHGWSAETIRRWLAAAGQLPKSSGPNHHVRVEIAIVDAVVAEQTRIREEQFTVTDHARRLGIRVNTLSRWLTDAGVPRDRFRPWIIETETVDRVVAERAARKTCRARIVLEAAE